MIEKEKQKDINLISRFTITVTIRIAIVIIVCRLRALRHQIYASSNMIEYADWTSGVTSQKLQK